VTVSPTPTSRILRGDANCDGRVSAADWPALLRNIVTGEQASCGGDDVNGDAHVDGADIEALTHATFGQH